MYIFYAANINTRTHIITSNSHLEHYYIRIKYETIYIIDIYMYIYNTFIILFSKITISINI